VNPLPNIAVREGSEHKLLDGTRFIVSEFSIPSAISQLKVLKELRHSTQAHNRNIAGKILKNAVVLQVVTARKGHTRCGDRA